MPSFCHNLSAHYAHLRTLTDAFTTQYERVKDSGDLTEVRRLKIQLEEAREAVLEQLCVFQVPNAINPYHEALLEAGIDPNKTQKREEITINIREEIERQLALYGEVLDADDMADLQPWMDDIILNKALIYAEVIKDRVKIMERIKEGMVPIVMPSRNVQSDLFARAMTMIQPLWIKNGVKQAIENTNLSYRFRCGILDYLALFLKNIPDRPYLVWVKPTQGFESITINKSYPMQQVVHATLVRKHPNLYDKSDIFPTEYIALQCIFTRLIRERYRKIEGETSEPHTIWPLDQSLTTRFLSMEKFTVDFSPHAYFDSNEHRVCCQSGNSEEVRSHGFRPASRT